ncbi:MAG: hypothetical protein JWP96_734 [Polaromonas sp.]|nr:hypothetical protein [Polaromonas sp.]
MAEERQGFLGRWARRKAEALQGKQPDEPAALEKPAPLAAVPAAGPAELPEKLLSLDDVKLLTKDSDFTPFMARNVGPEVRNAAMKKLFTDPRYNVMDGLDTYIGDYSQSDPIPETMLRQMAGTKFLKIFDDEAEPASQGDAAAPPSVNVNGPVPQAVAQSDDLPDASNLNSSGPEHASQHDHANPHLQLQPDHAAPAPGAGRGAA